MKFVPPGNIAGQFVISYIKRIIQDIGHGGKEIAGLASCIIWILLWSPRVFFKIWLRTVVLPAPRKPESMVTGSLYVCSIGAS